MVFSMEELGMLSNACREKAIIVGRDLSQGRRVSVCPGSARSGNKILVAFCSPAKNLIVSGLMENLLVGKKVKVLTSKQNATKKSLQSPLGLHVPRASRCLQSFKTQPSARASD